MQWWYDFLSNVGKYSGFYSFIISAISALLTGIYVVLTNRLLRETMKNSSPNVVIDIALQDNDFVLHISNIGNQMAHDLEINFNPELPTLGKQRKIVSLAPNASHKLYVGFIGKELLKDEERKISWKYKDSLKKEHCGERNINLSVFYYENPKDPIVDELKNISSALQTLTMKR